jgi:ASC-1-like (ASCH) protein
MDEKIKVKVLELRRYPTFEEMYKDIPFSLFDCEGWTLEEMINSTYEIYSKEQEQRWGVLAIKIQMSVKPKSYSVRGFVGSHGGRLTCWVDPASFCK